MATLLGSLLVSLGLESAEFTSGLDKADKNYKKFGRNVKTTSSGIERNVKNISDGVSQLRAVFAVDFLATAGKRALDYASSLGEVSQQLGVTTKDLQVYRYIATQVGVTQEEMEKGLAKLTQTMGKAALGSKAESTAITALGLSVRDANGHVKTAGEFIPQLADQLSKIQDPTKRAAIEVALFGRAGQKLDPLLSQGAKGIREFEKRAQELGLVLSDDLAKAADEAADRLAELKMQLEANIAKAVAQNANAIIGLANAIATLTTQAVNFISQYPRLSAALAGAAAGSRFGPAGIAVGAGAGFGLANAASNAADDANMDIGFRQKQMRAARDEFHNMQRASKSPGTGILSLRRTNSPRSAGDINGAFAEFQRQTKLLQQAGSSANAPKLGSLPPGFEVPDFLKSGGGGKGGGGKSDAAKALEDAKKLTVEYEKALAATQDQVRWDKMRADGLSDQADLQEAIKRITEQFPTLDAARLKILTDQVTVQVQQEQSIRKQKEAIEAAADAAKKAGDAVKSMTDKVMDATKDQLAEIADLQERIIAKQQDFADDIGESFGNALQDAINGKPLEGLKNLVNDLAKTFQKEFIVDPFKRMISEKVGGPLAKGLGVGGFIAEDGIPGMPGFATSLKKGELAINGFSSALSRGSFGSSVGGVGFSLPDGAFDPLKIDAVNDNFDALAMSANASANALGQQKAKLGEFSAGLLSILSQSAGGSSGGGGFLSQALGFASSLIGSGAIKFGGGGAVGNIAKGAGSVGKALKGLKIPKFASGTPFAPGGLSLVGERGPELVNLRRGSEVIANDQLGGIGGQTVHSPTFVFPGVKDRREARVAADQAALAYRRRMTPIVQGAA